MQCIGYIGCCIMFQFHKLIHFTYICPADEYPIEEAPLSYYHWSLCLISLFPYLLCRSDQCLTAHIFFFLTFYSWVLFFQNINYEKYGILSLLFSTRHLVSVYWKDEGINMLSPEYCRGLTQASTSQQSLSLEACRQSRVDPRVLAGKCCSREETPVGPHGSAFCGG